jgi:proline iminopeptidase
MAINSTSPSHRRDRITIPQGSLSVRLQGRGFPLLCLHGHPGSAQSLSVFTDSLSQRFQTLAPDLRGYGRSKSETDFQMVDHLSDLGLVLDHYQVDQCLVLGWSLGGILALELALQQPQRISGLILVATSARPWGNHPPVGWQDNLFTGLASLLNWLQPGWQWNIDTFGRRSLFRYLIRQHTETAYRYLARDALSAYLQTTPRATQALSQALRQGYNRLADLGRIQCPCLVLAGAEDRHITAASSQEMLSHLPQAEWRCYDNTAHLFPWEVPDQVLADIDRWLQRFPSAMGLTH